MWKRPVFLFAVVGQAGYDIAHKLAGKEINSFLGAAIVGATEIALTSIYFIFFYRTGTQSNVLFTFKGIFLAILIGIFGWCIDVPLLASYKDGHDLTKIAPFVIVGALALSAIFGFAILRESLTASKIAGIFLGIISCYLILK